jgi:hypothetical protein
LPSAEADRRLKALKALKGNKLTAKDCIGLGDAVFAFFAPNQSAILTTNIKDHAPLAASLGKQAISPAQVLAP